MRELSQIPYQPNLLTTESPGLTYPRSRVMRDCVQTISCLSYLRQVNTSTGTVVQTQALSNLQVAWSRTISYLKETTTHLLHQGACKLVFLSQSIKNSISRCFSNTKK